jgi:hypothetical protein
MRKFYVSLLTFFFPFCCITVVKNFRIITKSRRQMLMNYFCFENMCEYFFILLILEAYTLPTVIKKLLIQRKFHICL